jgi:hypothetical protein
MVDLTSCTLLRRATLRFRGGTILLRHGTDIAWRTRST